MIKYNLGSRVGICRYGSYWCLYENARREALGEKTMTQLEEEAEAAKEKSKREV